MDNETAISVLDALYWETDNRELEEAILVATSALRAHKPYRIGAT